MIANIQALRAIAALLVVCFHLSDFLSVAGLPAFGSEGVDLFFVISGFVMVHTTERRVPTPSVFIRNRIARIVPIYWLMTLIVYGVATLAPSWVKSTGTDPLQLVESLAFIPFRKGSGMIQPVLFVGWTLNYEMFFYALFAAGLASKSYRAGLAGTICILLILVLLGVVFHPEGAIPAFYTNPRILEFALGMMVALLTAEIPQQVGPGARRLGFLSLLMLPVIVVAPHIWQAATPAVTAGLPAALLLAGVVLLERSGNSINSPLMLLTGDASYMLYLSHPYLTIPIQKLAMARHPIAVTSLVLAAATSITVVVVAIVLHRLVERPFTRGTRRLLAVDRAEARPAMPRPTQAGAGVTTAVDPIPRQGGPRAARGRFNPPHHP